MPYAYASATFGFIPKITASGVVPKPSLGFSTHHSQYAGFTTGHLSGNKTGIGAPRFSGRPKHHGHQGLSPTSCSGTLSIGVSVTRTVTATITSIVGTVTLATGDPVPSPTYLTPAPYCATVCLSNGEEGVDILCSKFRDLRPQQITTSTLLVTEKTTAVAYTPRAVGSIFGPSPVAMTSEDVTSIEPFANSKTQSADGETQPTLALSEPDSSEPPLSVPQGNVGQLPGFLPLPQDTPQTKIDKLSESDSPGLTASSIGSTAGPGSGSGDPPDGRPSSTDYGPSQNDQVSQTDPIDTSADVPDLHIVGGSSSHGGESAETVNSGSPSEASNLHEHGESAQSVVPTPEMQVHSGADEGPNGANPAPSKADTGHPASPANSPPAKSDIFGSTIVTPNGVPMLLSSTKVVIGETTYEVVGRPSIFTDGGKTYTMGVSGLVAGQTTLPLPLEMTTPAIVSAGGQIFSVYPSSLEAQGMTVVRPANARPSHFVYKDQTYTLNPSQLLVPDNLIPLPTPPPSAAVERFVYAGKTFTIDDSRVIAPSTLLTIAPGQSNVVIDGQTLTVQPSQVIAPSTTIAISPIARAMITTPPTVITVDGVAISICPSAAFIGSETHSFVPGQRRKDIEYRGRTLTLDLQDIRVDDTTIPVPKAQPSFSLVTKGAVTLSVASSEVVLSDYTYHLSGGMVPITTRINGQSVVIGPSGVFLSGTTLALSTLSAALARKAQVVTVDGVIMTVSPADVVKDGETYTIGPNASPTTLSIDGKMISLGAAGIGLSDTTVAPTATTPVSVTRLGMAKQLQETQIVTADGVVLTVEPAGVIIQGKSYTIGLGATPTSLILGQETISLGPEGIGLADTTVAPVSLTAVPSSRIGSLVREQSLEAKIVTADGMVFTVEPTDVIIQGKTYHVGPWAPQKTITLNKETISLGPGGIGLSDTTIIPTSTVAGSQRGFSIGTSSAESSQIPGRLSNTPETNWAAQISRLYTRYLVIFLGVVAVSLNSI